MSLAIESVVVSPLGDTTGRKKVEVTAINNGIEVNLTFETWVDTDLNIWRDGGFSMTMRGYVRRPAGAAADPI